MKTKTVKKTRVLNESREEIFKLIKRFDTLYYIASPLMTFEPLNGDRELLWILGAEFKFKLKLLSFIPFGIHKINVKVFNDKTHEVYTEESNTYVPIWNHRITLQASADGKTLYTDEVEIGCGVKTSLIYLWAKIFYAHRQRRWSKLIKKRQTMYKQ